MDNIKIKLQPTYYPMRKNPLSFQIKLPELLVKLGYLRT